MNLLTLTIYHFIQIYINLDELVHMLRQINPSLVFCELENIETVKIALKELHMNTSIYCFDDPLIDGSKFIDELFLETGIEEEFV